MLIRILLLLISLVILSACVQDPQGFLRKSANNKYFDMKGFHESKRLPVYNAKYIERAKENILSGGYDSRNTDREAEEPDEIENPQAYHREIYKQMAIGDRENQQTPKKKNKKRKKQKQSFYSKIAHVDLEEYEEGKITSKSVKIKEPMAADADHRSRIQNITDDFGDEIEYETDDDNIFAEPKIEKISNDFKEEKVDVKAVVSQELENQKKQMQKEFDEMKAILQARNLEKEEKSPKINVHEVVSKEIEAQKIQLQKELDEVKLILKTRQTEQTTKINTQEVVNKEMESQKRHLQNELDEIKLMLKTTPVQNEAKIPQVDVQEVVNQEMQNQKRELQAELDEMKFILQSIKEKVVTTKKPEILHLQQKEVTQPVKVAIESKSLIEKSRSKMLHKKGKMEINMQEIVEESREPEKIQGGFLIY
jgi:hypothetical protein